LILIFRQGLFGSKSAAHQENISAKQEGNAESHADTRTIAHPAVH
jgi:hypothetical protein